MVAVLRPLLLGDYWMRQFSLGMLFELLLNRRSKTGAT